MIIEIKIKVYLLKQIVVAEALGKMSKLIDTMLAQNSMTHFHEANQMKLYTYTGLYPISKNGVYEAGQVCSFVIRTLNEELGKLFERDLDKQSTTYMKALTLEKRVVKQKPLERIFSINPIIIKYDKEGYWREKHSAEAFESRLKIGLVQKYNRIYNTKIEENFEWFNYFKIDNRKPIATKYKNITLLGDKITLGIASNEVAQQLAWIAVGSGVGEMNARGFGSVNYRYL